MKTFVSVKALLLLLPLLGDTLLSNELPSSDARTHWAFQSVRRTTPPPDPSGWAESPIDRFIAARFRERGLEPNGAAERRALIRRLTFDLHGLPPSFEDVEAFAAATAPDAYVRLVDRLLASPRYGERWGRHWLDLARYSDTQGGSADYPIPEARFYRDYVIEAFNADKPYDEFLREQLAGDIIAAQRPDGRYSERVIATAFVGLSVRNGIFKHYNPQLIIEDTLDVIGRSILGLTLTCARCHDHKFDPVSTADYYRLYGIFASSTYPFSGAEFPPYSADGLVPLISPSAWKILPGEKRQDLETRRKRIDEALAKNPSKAKLEEKTAKLLDDTALFNDKLARGIEDVALRIKIDDQDIRIREVLAKIDRDVRDLREELRAAEETAGIARAYAMSEGAPHDATIQIAGDPFRHGPTVRRGLPEVFARGRQLEIPTGASGRLELAEWLTSAENPLTARVAVNFIWQSHFGKGLVTTPDNFGLRGAPPTHPELLDWLASEFVETGWLRKALHRAIVTSKTYQLSSDLRPPDNDNDNDDDASNLWYTRFERRRLSAEEIRDAILAVSGNLELSRPGAHPFPPRSAWAWTQHNPFKAVYPSNHRSVYLMTQRVQRHPFLALFDGADPCRATSSRRQTNLALQALYMKNSPFVFQQSAAAAEKLMGRLSDSRQRMRWLIQSAWSRPPKDTEVATLVAHLERYRGELESLLSAAAPDDAESRQPDQSGLLLEYLFEGDARDSSEKGQHGRLVDNAATQPGRSGLSLVVDGIGDFVDSGTSLSELSDSFTVECWVKPAAQQNPYANIFGNHSDGGRGFVMQQAGHATNQFLISYGVDNNRWVMSSPVRLTAERWQHVAMVKSSDAFRFYVDGVVRAEVLSRDEMAPTSQTFLVGLGYGNPRRCFRGQIDDVRVWSRAIETFDNGASPASVDEQALASCVRLILAANEFVYVE